MGFTRFARMGSLAVLIALISGCGGGGDSGGGSGGGGGAVAVAPAISTQPASISVVAGQTAAFAVTATGTAPLSYQWVRGGADIAGATAANYTTAATTLADNGASFTVRVTNSAGSATSAAAILTVTAPTPAPVITTQPASQTVIAGQPATFAVAASGTGLTYQWSRSGATLAGAASASYTIAATTLADSGATFQVRVSNGSGQVDSTVATLTVTTPPVSTGPTPVRLSAGPGYTLARLADGSVIAWGSAMAGGSGPAYAGSNAHRINGLANIAAVSAFNTSQQSRPTQGDAAQHSLAIAADGTVYGWGWDSGGVTENATFRLVDTAVAVTRLGASKAVVTNSSLSIALHADGTVWYTPGTLRIGLTNSSSARQVQGLDNVVALADMHSLHAMAAAVKADGSLWRLYMVGTNPEPGVSDYTLSVQSLGAPTGTIQASCAGIDPVLSPGFLYTFYCLALTGDGRVWSWGANNVGQLGDGTRTDHSAPAPIAGLAGMRQVLATGGMSYALSNDGHVYSWGGYGDSSGADLSARLPARNSGLDDSLLVPGVVLGVQDIVEITGAGGDVRFEARGNVVHIAALKRDGTVWTWGADCCLQLGQATTTVSPAVPIVVPGVNLN